MSDLSRLLEDVYRTSAPAPEPSWASDTALDEAFADWVPTEPDAVLEVEPPPTAPPVAPEAGPPDDVAVAPSLVTGWCREDDDILPLRSGRRRRISLRHR